MNAERSSPQIAEYECYRSYLRDLFEYKKKFKSGFSFRQIAGAVGFGSPNYLQLVIQAKKNLSESTAERLAQALKLSRIELAYFVALVQKENAETSSDREKAERDLHAVKKNLISKPLLEEHQEVVSEWYHLLVRELVLLKDFSATGKYISQKLNGLISEEEAESSLKLLLRTGYVYVDGGKYMLQDPVLDTGLDIFTHQLMQQMHSRLLAVWASKIANLGSSGQELGVLNIPLSGKDVPELQKRIRRFQDEIIGWAESLQATSSSDQVVQLGTYLMNYASQNEN